MSSNEMLNYYRQKDLLHFIIQRAEEQIPDGAKPEKLPESEWEYKTGGLICRRHKLPTISFTTKELINAGIYPARKTMEVYEGDELPTGDVIYDDFEELMASHVSCSVGRDYQSTSNVASSWGRSYPKEQLIDGLYNAEYHADFFDNKETIIGILKGLWSLFIRYEYYHKED